MNAKLALAGLLLSLGSPAIAQTVVTTTGTVQGTTVGNVEKFLGIPYAEPPVGTLRWKRPVAKSPVAGIIDATLPKAACTQQLNTTTASSCRDNVSQGNGALVGSEDCLTLSVWRPSAVSATPRRVMVWIHGGGLTTGCAKDALTEASDLALQPAFDGVPPDTAQIVVAVQYRLGPMGFFSLPELQTEDANASVGNYGLLDQALALQWVHDNIAAFGGDPNNVTIFGESAGGFSTYIHEASPIAQANFTRAISESGLYGQAIPLAPGAGAPAGSFDANGTAFSRGINLASSATLGCTDPGTRVACMRGKSAADVFAAWSPMAGSSIAAGATPVIDGYVLTEQPAQMLKERVTPPKSFMLGANANEMTAFTLTGPSLPDAASYENAIRGIFGTVAGNTILSIYPAAAFPTPLAAYQRVLEDILFVCPTFNVGKLIHDKGATSYVYHFANPVSGFLGAFHGSELYYVFGNTALLSSVFVTPDAGDTLLSDAIQREWTHFALDGLATSVGGVLWSPFDPGAGPASAGGVYVWNLTPSNLLNNSFVPAGTLREGRCAQLADPVNDLNGDYDAFTNDRDNCPFATNTDQADAGAIGADPSDGIGDRCQCGDLTDNGIVDAGDVSAYRGFLTGSAPLSPRAAAKCKVESHSAACDIVDVAVMRRRLASPALGPGIGQLCTAANPA